MGERYKSARTTVAIILVIAVMLGFAYDLFGIQIKNNEYYLAQSSAVKTYTVPIEAAKGDIVDRNGNTLVTNRKGNSIPIPIALIVIPLFFIFRNTFFICGISPKITVSH